ncbi:MAG: cysteine desulfurase [Coriobacteriales bacterium]|jgi:cysteine desulfurase|nr:cysteine desulfurase [Coriobacteriales bacterium]
MAAGKTIYLDYAATAPLAQGVLEAMRPHLNEQFANPNALYKAGKQARFALEQSREKLAHAVGAAPAELAFCSGGTEANNMALVGIAEAVRRSRGAQANHIVCAAFEHPSVLETVKGLKRANFEISFVQPNREGFISVESLKSAIKNSTILASVMLAQNEIGTVQPISELAAAVHEMGREQGQETGHGKGRQTTSNGKTPSAAPHKGNGTGYGARPHKGSGAGQGILFHTDAVQALGKIPVNLAALGVDAASFSAHKIGGPKGVGMLYLKRKTPFEALLRGGGQEAGRRSGTQNVAGAVGFAAAAKLATDPQRLAKESERLIKLRDSFAQKLSELDPRVRLSVPLASGNSTHHLPNLVSCTIDGFESETLLLRLDEAGIAASGGSACSTGSLEPSPTLLSLGMSKDRAYGALRFTLGASTAQHDLDSCLAVLSNILARR